MIDFVPLLKILPISTLAMMSPGPDFLIVSSTALSRGRAHGIQAAVGIATGVLIYSTLALLGIAALLEQALWLAIALKVLGGLYLIYLGIAAWRSTFTSSGKTPPPKTAKARSAYVSGLLTNLTNPKFIAFCTSIFVFALTPETNLETKVALIAMAGISPLIWFSLVATVLSRPAMRARYQQARKTIDRIAGSIMILFGIKLVSSAAD